MTDEEYMQEALKQAQIAYELNEIPVGAIVVYNNQIIGKGYNTRETTAQVSGHAEMNAIKEACEFIGSWQLDGCSIYVTAEPCPMCAGTILQARIQEVYYGVSNQKAGFFGSLFDITDIQGLNHYPRIHRHILEEPCKEIMQSFFKKMRNDRKTIIK